jgi:two-component system, LytTR family, response regulator
MVCGEAYWRTRLSGFRRHDLAALDEESGSGLVCLGFIGRQSGLRLDYLLKPFDRERFEQAFARAIRQIENQKEKFSAEKIISLLSDSKPHEKYVEHFIIKANGRVFFLKAEEIIWIESEGNYVMLHTARKSHIFRETLTNLEENLNPHKFRRINRSSIVNLEFVRELHPHFRGDYIVFMQNGTELKLSRRYRGNLTQFFGGSL